VNANRVLLIGDNPFNGVSHLSQQRAIARGNDIRNPEYAYKIVCRAFDNGADGFMFSVSDTTLSILRLVGKEKKYHDLKLYAIVPNVSEFVRLATTAGGIPGLAKIMGKEIIRSGNLISVFHGIKGAIANDPPSLLKAYLLFEESRTRNAAGKIGSISSIFIHELLTDLALSLNLKWVFLTHIELMRSRGIKPGFHTHNLPYLVNKFQEWHIDCRKLAFTTQYNAIGFWMSPSREESEAVLAKIPESEIIAYGILASGYLKVPEAVNYIKGLPQISGLAFGASKEEQVRETFITVKSLLGN
jgi:hypothetical protein